MQPMTSRLQCNEPTDHPFLSHCAVNYEINTYSTRRLPPSYQLNRAVADSRAKSPGNFQLSFRSITIDRTIYLLRLWLWWLEPSEWKRSLLYVVHIANEALVDDESLGRILTPLSCGSAFEEIYRCIVSYAAPSGNSEKKGEKNVVIMIIKGAAAAPCCDRGISQRKTGRKTWLHLLYPFTQIRKLDRLQQSVCSRLAV